MKNTIRILSSVIILAMMFSLTGCYYDEVVENSTINENVSFANDIQPLFNANCVACHPSLSDPDLTEGNSYNFIRVIDPALVVPGDANGSELYQRLTGVGNIMPPSGSLSNADIKLVEDWINQGALNN
jgi:hypothetical protein